MIEPQAPDLAESGIQVVPIQALTPDNLNANQGTERGLKMLEASLAQLGAGRSILTDKSGVVIAGNKTLESAAALGVTEVLLVPTDGTRLVAVVRTDLDMSDTVDPRARRLALADNRVGQVDLAWNPEALLALAQEFGEDITADLWSPEEWRATVMANLDLEGLQGGRPAPRESDLAGLAETWGTESGQAWRIPSLSRPGEFHRLACGDAGNQQDITRALGGQVPRLLITSPPYWVGMEYETQRSEREIDEFINRCATAWAGVMPADFGRIVIDTGTAAIHRVEKGRPVEVLPLVERWQAALKPWGWLMRHLRIWAKSGGGLQGVTGTLSPHTDAVDMHWEHLATLTHSSQEKDLDTLAQALGQVAGPAALQALDWAHLATWWNPQGDYRGQEKVGQPWAQQGVWDDIRGEAGADGAHVAAFPIEVPRRFILLYSRDGETVLDPFLGSGTTLLAAEALGRLCVGLELSPAYLAAALQRFADSGLVPEQESE